MGYEVSGIGKLDVYFQFMPKIESHFVPFADSELRTS